MGDQKWSPIFIDLMESFMQVTENSTESNRLTMAQRLELRKYIESVWNFSSRYYRNGHTDRKVFEHFFKVWRNLHLNSVTYFRAQVGRQDGPVLYQPQELVGKLVPVTTNKDNPRKDRDTTLGTDVIINGINISHSSRLVEVLLNRINYLEKELGVC